MKPQPWTQIRIPEHHPDTWPNLPGYKEAFLGEFKPEPTATLGKVTKTRTRRTVVDLTRERDALTRERDWLGRPTINDDPGALSGIRRKPTHTDRKQADRDDRELDQFTRLTRRIDCLDMRIRRDAT